MTQKQCFEELIISRAAGCEIPVGVWDHCPERISGRYNGTILDRSPLGTRLNEIILADLLSALTRLDFWVEVGVQALAEWICNNG